MLLNIALAVVTGLLLILIHPRFDAALLAPFAPAPLLYALAREWSPRRRFFLGYIAGVVFWAGMCYWIHFVMSVHGRLGPVLGAGVFLLFCLLKGLHLGVFGLLGGILMRRSYAVAAIPPLWVAIERIPDPFGFMWLHLGNAGVNMGVPMRLAPLTGVYGLSFLFAMMATALTLIALGRPRVQLAPVALVLIPLLLPRLPDPQQPSSTAVSVQPNIDETAQWTAEMVAQLNQSLEYLSLKKALESRPRLILWPEMPAPIYYYDDPPLRERVAQIARLTGAHVLMGTVAYNDKKAPLNAALIVAPDGRVLGRYDKMFLVPFGEYIPAPFGGIATRITNEIGDFVPGERVVTFKTGADTVGPFICYESAFPHLVRRFVLEGATVLVNLSNDGYFGRTAAREQHLQLVRMRAAENRRWILRATNDGITATVDPAGRVVQRFEPFRQDSFIAAYSAVADLTRYSRWGDWFAWTCAAGAVVALLGSQVPAYRRVSPNMP
ncbi:MAG TPA: apolipoprotein N-acyltransferase [Bryobacteraceae bacterium]|nr:apolipoprotein N-acyltransferase [Bryobacteraceae bacterium]